MLAAAAGGHAAIAELLLEAMGGQAAAAPGKAAATEEEEVEEEAAGGRAVVAWAGSRGGGGAARLQLLTLPQAVAARPRCAVVHGCHVLDGYFCVGFLRRLSRLWSSLPLAPKTKPSPIDRFYFADSEHWVTRRIDAALREALSNDGTSDDCGGVVTAPLARFLCYASPGGELPVHVDLARTWGGGLRSTHSL